MKIGLLDVDGSDFPNLALMKISAYHKNQGDGVEFVFPFTRYDRVYVSKVFGDEYSTMPQYHIQADEIIYGGTGFAIKIQNGKEAYYKDLDPDLQNEIEHCFPDYSLYPKSANTAMGFLTRGCPNNCEFCIVSKKEGRCSRKVANLDEFFNGQKHINLLDPNILACKDRLDLLDSLIDSKAKVNFSQGLDARFITEEIAHKLNQIKKDAVHFAFDFMKNEKNIIEGLKTYAKIVGLPSDLKKRVVYVLTNFNTTHEEDIYRVKVLQDLGFAPDIRIYRKNTAPMITRDLQRWCNNRTLFRSCKWEDYVPRVDGKSIRQLYYSK